MPAVATYATQVYTPSDRLPSIKISQKLSILGAEDHEPKESEGVNCRSLQVIVHGYHPHLLKTGHYTHDQNYNRA
jgi:hypothetical protein